MPQTLLGLLGLTLAGMIAYNQQRVTVRSYEVRLEDEYIVAASGVMMHAMELIAARSFDEQTTPAVIEDRQSLPDQATEFTLPNGFGAAGRGPLGCNLERPALTPECDDVDDLDGLQHAPIAARLSNGEQIPFEVSVEVFYVDDADLRAPVNYRTRNKRVVLTARTPLLPEVAELVRLERVVAYDPLKAEADHDAAGYAPIDG